MRSFLSLEAESQNVILGVPATGFELVVPWPSGPVDVVSVEAAIAAFHRRHVWALGLLISPRLMPGSK